MAFNQFRLNILCFLIGQIYRGTSWINKNLILFCLNWWEKKVDQKSSMIWSYRCTVGWYFIRTKLPSVTYWEKFVVEQNLHRKFTIARTKMRRWMSTISHHRRNLSILMDLAFSLSIETKMTEHFSAGWPIAIDNDAFVLIRFALR